MSDYQVSYKISENATRILITLFLIFLAGIGIKTYSILKSFDIFDVAYLILFIVFFTFSSAAIWKFLIKKQPVIVISSKDISIAVPYFFEMARIPLANIREIKVSVWSRSEIVFQSGPDYKKLAFMSAFLSGEDRESFLSNIFDLLPNTQVT